MSYKYIHILLLGINLLYIHFRLISKQSSFSYVNHALFHSSNQPVLSNEGTVSSSRKKEITGAFDEV